MSVYQVENQWGGNNAPWHQGNTWILSGRADQPVIAVDIKSDDHGETFSGFITYQGEGPIGFKAQHEYANVYAVEVQWGGGSEPWHVDGSWVIGGRDTQRCIQLNVTASEGDKVLSGDMTYDGEGKIGFKSKMTPAYIVENQWGGTSAPWHAGGTWALSGRYNQDVISMDIRSSDNGKTLEGTMTYPGEGPIGFKGIRSEGNNYEVSNQWGGSSAPWHRGGNMIIGNRKNQQVIKLKFSSENGEQLAGEMTYTGEGSIGFKAELVSVGAAAAVG